VWGGYAFFIKEGLFHMTPYAFGQHVHQQMKTAGMLGNMVDGLSNSWNNASRVFKGGTGAIAGGLGAAGAGLAGGAMQGANAVGGVFGAKPFSDTSVNTAYGTAGHFANAAKGYGQDLAQGLGLGPQGLAGTTMNNPSAGDAYVQKVQNMPGVTDDARRLSAAGMTAADFASKAAPAAAIGGGIQMASNLAAGAPVTAGISSASPAAVAKPVASNMASRAAQKTLGVAKGMNSSSNPIGAGVNASIAAARAGEHYKPQPIMAPGMR
jgi:hypothetical protein